MAEAGKNEGRTAATPELKRAIADFKATLYELGADAGLRVSVFGKALEQRMGQSVEDLEESVTAWFDQFLSSAPHEHRIGLDAILRDAHRRMFQVLMNFEFDRWS